jgi:hypothetical protein
MREVAPMTPFQELPPPPGVNLYGMIKKNVCTACAPPREFRTPAAMALHFNQAHANLVKDKDTWRQYNAANRK